MNIIFLGYAISIDEAAGLYGASVAGNNMQINILKELNTYKDLNINSITIYPTAAYPKGKIFIKRKQIRLFNDYYSLRASLINLPIIKNLYETFIAYAEAVKLCKTKKVNIILTFNMFPQTGIPAMLLKRRYGVEIVTILADLPIDDTTKRNIFIILLRKVFDYITKKGIKAADKIIALNKNAVMKYAPDTKYIVVEGGINEVDISNESIISNKSKHIVYTGALVEYSGIINLMKAMKYVQDKNVILDIYGSGQIKSIVEAYANKSNNIIYHGKKSPDYIRKVQNNAYLLINPRPTDDKIVNVTFPSKLFEYMISNTPVLTTKINGLTNEYLDKVYTVNNNDPKMLAYKINEIMGLPKEELDQKAILAKKFILENKTWQKQCKKIYNFINEGR